MTVTHNAVLSRYEMETEHGLGVAVYQPACSFVAAYVRRHPEYQD